MPLLLSDFIKLIITILQVWGAGWRSTFLHNTRVCSPCAHYQAALNNARLRLLIRLGTAEWSYPIAFSGLFLIGPAGINTAS